MTAPKPFPGNLAYFSGRLARPAHYFPSNDRGSASVVGTVISRAEVEDNFGDTEVKKTYVDFRVTDPALIEVMTRGRSKESGFSGEVLPEGATVRLAGRVYLGKPSESTNSETGEVTKYPGKLSCIVDSPKAGHVAEVDQPK